MKIILSDWLISTLKLYNYPVTPFITACANGDCSCYKLNVFLYNVYYNSANNTVNAIFIFDPSTCSIGINGPICAVFRFDNQNVNIGAWTSISTTYWCNYSVYEVISLIGAN